MQDSKPSFARDALCWGFILSVYCATPLPEHDVKMGNDRRGTKDRRDCMSKMVRIFGGWSYYLQQSVNKDITSLERSACNPAPSSTVTLAPAGHVWFWAETATQTWTPSDLDRSGTESRVRTACRVVCRGLVLMPCMWRFREAFANEVPYIKVVCFHSSPFIYIYL